MARRIKKMVLPVFLTAGIFLILLLGILLYYHSLQMAVLGKEYQAAQAQAATDGVDIGYFGAKWFWIQYETGKTDESAFATVLGDNGAAFGIQYDYRYTLRDFLAYCVEADPIAYHMFLPFTEMDKPRLKGNQQLADAWILAYTQNKEDFIERQKDFCNTHYYEPAEAALTQRGIRIKDRSEVCKGAVLSFVFQGCSPGIWNAVVRAGITDETTDEEFLKKLYSYRKGLYYRYANRYDQELQTALTLLHALENGGYVPGDGGFQNPCPEAYVSSEYGPRNVPTAGASSYHRGRDYAAGTGTRILASAPGTVKTVDYNSIRGNFLVVDHGNGIESWYQHCSEILAVPGQIVMAGQTIAKVGSTGISTGPHLHFEIHVDGEPVDPRAYLE